MNCYYVTTMFIATRSGKGRCVEKMIRSSIPPDHLFAILIAEPSTIVMYDTTLFEGNQHGLR